MQKKNNFQTPLPVAKYMASLIPAGVKTVLEPTPGDGNILSFLSDYEVTAPEDFFLLTPAQYHCIIMNPPFSSKQGNIQNASEKLDVQGLRLGYHILKECMQRSDNIIALLTWFTITDSDVRLRELMSFGLKEIISLPRKTFTYSRIQTCILVLKRGFTGTTHFKTFNY